MVDGLNSIRTDGHKAALSVQASDELKKKQKKEIEKDNLGAVGMSAIPKEADARVAVEDIDGDFTVAETEAAESILFEIDAQLANVQKGLKEFIGKKIKLAANNPAKGKELLKSAYRDTKKAYDKIKKVREHLA